MRLFVMRHTMEPHHAAIPLALTGYESGSPQLASHGAHLNRFLLENTQKVRKTPNSYVIYHDSVANALDQNTDAASSVGLHSSVIRPMAIRLESGNTLIERLKRKELKGHQATFDNAVNHYLERYQARLQQSGIPVRSETAADFAFARTCIYDAPELAAILPPNLLAWADAQTCGSELRPDQTATGLKLAAHLLNHPAEPASHVTLMEAGLLPDGTGLGFDTHRSHVERASTNTVHFFQRFVDRINKPGENNPAKLDLDKQLIIVNTEFGRTPYPEVTPSHPNGTGLDHWPWGYVVAVFGGFVDEDKSGVIGSIGEDANAVDYFTPTELRAALLLASGIWPFEPESFRVSGVRDAKNELEAAMFLKEMVLGFKT
jgi:hypothetical protein